jgi:hypothetical protein
MMVSASNLLTVTPTTNSTPALANTIAAPAGFDPMAPGNIWASFGTAGIEGDVYAVELTRASAVGAVAENVRRESVSRSLSWVLEAPYSLTAATEKAREFVKGFAEDWGLLRKTNISRIKLWGEEYDSVPEALKAMVDQGKLDGVTANAVATEALLSAWTQEPGNTLADLVNAVTRYAHTAKVGIERQEKIERAAGDLIPVLVREFHRSN